jgi:hypothetical protein
MKSNVNIRKLEAFYFFGILAARATIALRMGSYDIAGF